MTIQDAIGIAVKSEAFEPAFYGEVVMRIKAGGITAVDVKRTFIAQ